MSKINIINIIMIILLISYAEFNEMLGKNLFGTCSVNFLKKYKVTGKLNYLSIIIVLV